MNRRAHWTPYCNSSAYTRTACSNWKEVTFLNTYSSVWTNSWPHHGNDLAHNLNNAWKKLPRQDDESKNKYEQLTIICSPINDVPERKDWLETSWSVSAWITLWQKTSHASTHVKPRSISTGHTSSDFLFIGKSCRRTWDKTTNDWSNKQNEHDNSVIFFQTTVSGGHGLLVSFCCRFEKRQSQDKNILNQCTFLLSFAKKI